MDSPPKATTPERAVEAGEGLIAAPAGARDNPGSAAAGSKPAHEPAAAPGLATPADHRREALGALIRLAMHGRPPGVPEGAMAGAPTPQALLEAALKVALAYGFIEPKRANTIAAACADMGTELGIPAEVRTWRRIRDELRTLRQALHIDGEQTATEAARGLEDVAAAACERLSVSFPPDDTSYVRCSACDHYSHFDGDEGPDAYKLAIERVEHDGKCVLALAWRALGKPGPVGYP